MTPPEFDLLYLNRHEADVLHNCVRIVEQAPQGDFEWEWRRARLFHFGAMQTQESQSESEASSLFYASAQHANIAQKLDAQRVEGAFWSGTCELEAARSRSKLALAGVVGRAQKALNQAARIDSAFHFAGPLRVLGRLLHHKPRFLGGTLKGAIAFYERALQIAPRNSTNGIYMADALLADRQFERAREALILVIDNSDMQNWVWETLRDQRIAHEWLKSRFD